MTRPNLKTLTTALSLSLLTAACGTDPDRAYRHGLGDAEVLVDCQFTDAVRVFCVAQQDVLHKAKRREQRSRARAQTS